ncbi:hypothetical protein GS934_18290 [Rhodococcus hoagii]|nr:hypothetical protein [Prescottella equi]NKZ88271.1 hypothetical protein [Prescottella equi]
MRERSGAPTNPTEALVAEAYSAALGTDVDRLDDFFVVGGDSLLATAVVSQLRARLGRELPLRLLFDEPTVAGLAAAIEGGRFAAADGGPVAGNRPERLPLSRASNGCGPSVGPVASNGIGWGRGWNCAVRWFRTPCTPH